MLTARREPEVNTSLSQVKKCNTLFDLLHICRSSKTIEDVTQQLLDALGPAMSIFYPGQGPRISVIALDILSMDQGQMTVPSILMSPLQAISKWRYVTDQEEGKCAVA